MIEVHQLVPSVVPGDATTAHTLEMQRVLQNLGYHSNIYATAIHENLEDRVRLLHELRGPGGPRRFLIYQMSSHSFLADWVQSHPDRLAVNYHNLTPYQMLRAWDRGAVLSLRAAAFDAAQLGRIAGLGICDSQFNASDLADKGWEAARLRVVPVLINLAEFEADADADTLAVLARQREIHPGSRWLFVGGISPHKAQHRLIEAFAMYRETFDRDSTLTLVGRPVVSTYAEALSRYVHELGLESVVTITGGVSHRELVAYFEEADVFVSASEHEGFCVPLIEALYHGLPVVARADGAVEDTLGGAGLVIEDPRPMEMACAVDRVLRDGDLRDTLLGNGRRRLECFDLERTSRQMSSVVSAWVESQGGGRS